MPSTRNPDRSQRDPGAVRILVVCDFPIHAAALQSMLAWGTRFDPRLVAVGEAFRALEERPDLPVVIDIHGGSREFILKRLIQASDSHRMTALCVEGRNEALRLFSLGCGACVGTMSRPHEVGDAIEAVLDGNLWCSPCLLGPVLSTVQTAKTVMGDGRIELLTAREREIMLMVEQGMANKEIAAELSIAVPTVKNHLRNVSRKLGVRNRWQAARSAREHVFTT